MQATLEGPSVLAAPLRGGGLDPRRRTRCGGDAPPTPGEARSLGRLVRPADQWRLFPDLREHARFLDIETLGLALTDPITTVGISDAWVTTVLVSGRDLGRARLCEELGGARLLVTFNGTTFDLPRLRRAFPGLPFWDLPHLDLARLGRRVGLRGGLKAIERAIGYRRAPGVRELTGLEAARLWEAHRAGDRDALPRLVRYCRADTESLAFLADHIYERLARDAGSEGWLARPDAER